MTKEQKKLIKETLKEFDFDTVHKVMVFLDWKWGLGNDSHVPTTAELVLQAQSMCEDVIETCESEHKAEHSMSTGGFEVTYYAGDTEGDIGVLVIKFVLERWGDF